MRRVLHKVKRIMLTWFFSLFKRKLSHAEWWAKYREYLQSEKWKKKRQKVLKRDNFECQYRVWIFFKCKSKKKLQVHHKTYKRVFRERMSDLVTLCEKCHKKEHKKIKKQKRKK